MKTSVTPAGLEESALWNRSRWIGALLRAAAITAFLSASIGGLAFMAIASRVGPRRLEVPTDALEYVLAVGLQSAPVFFCAALVIECQLILLTGLGWSFRTCLVWLPILWGVFGGLLAWHLFPQADFGPKTTMLMAGGALTMLLGVNLQLSLAPGSDADGPHRVEPPLAWFVAVVLTGCVFFGGLHGWLDVRPELKQLLKYRQASWAHRPTEKLPPGQERESPLSP